MSKTNQKATRSSVTVPVKKLTADAILPTKNLSTDACFDLYSNKQIRIGGGGKDLVSTGIAFNIPPGYFGKIYERSGVSTLRPLSIKGGVIDAGYTGEIKIIVYNHGDMPEVIDKGTKLAQIAIHEVPTVELVQVEELESTDRADKGFGSSDKK